MAVESVPGEASPPIFAFEEVGADLDLLPIAARRALDHAGLRLSLAGWRSLPREDRLRLTWAGVPDIVDVALVATIVERAAPPAAKMDPERDPNSASVPPDMSSSAVPLHQWAVLRPLERYALVRARASASKRGSPAVFDAALVTILGGLRQNGAQAAPSSVSPTLPEYALTQEPSPFRPTEPPAWSVPAGLPPEDSQPGLMRALSPDALRTLIAPSLTSTNARANAGPSVARRDADGVDETPGRSRATLPSVSSIDRPDSSMLSSHLDASGAARMVDISDKSPTMRRAVASGSVRMLPATAMRILRADAPKGEVIGAARIAGIMAAKRTPELIPLCHAIALTHVGVEIQVRVDAGDAEVCVTATTEALDRTGVEMEAMVAVSVACLTIYDMLKGIDRAMTITDVKLIEKSGGRSGYFRREGPTE